MKRFNVTGTCVGTEHYMVDISGKLDEIEKLVDDKCYFTINRARQYGKTTTLFHLAKRLGSRGDYICARITFEDAGPMAFDSEGNLCEMFLEKISKSLRFTNAEKGYVKKWYNPDVSNFKSLSEHITDMCEGKKIVLMIDEVDKASNNRLFLHFLALLRSKFLSRQEGMDFTFHSVILAGVTDIKNLKQKMISDGLYTPLKKEDKIINSPWNIATDFEVNMSFSPDEISTMLTDYDTDNKTYMDISEVAAEIHRHTDGYPQLVSRICKHIVEKLSNDWSPGGVNKAVQIILKERNVLFDDMVKNLENNKDLNRFMYEILILGERKSFNLSNMIVDLASKFCYIKEGERGNAIISNRIFEIYLTGYYISQDENRGEYKRIKGVIYQDVIHGDKFDMAACMLMFAEHYREIYSPLDEVFFERHGRLLFLSFLTPLLNGQGFIHIETQLTDRRRMDLVVNFENQQHTVELKLWKGEAAKERAYEQLLGYMETKNAAEGYLLTFDFRKHKTGEYNPEWVEVGDKRIFDVVV